MTPSLPADARAFIDEARVARLATVTPDGRLHVVPVCPALDGDRIVIASEPSQKVRNVRDDPRVGIAFDVYEEDWSALRGVSVSGRAAITADGPEWDRGRAILYEKFPQYEHVSPIEPGRTVILSVDVEWASSGGL